MCYDNPRNRALARFLSKEEITMKKITALLLLLGLMMSLCACGNQSEPVQESDNLVPMEPVLPEATVDPAVIEEIMVASETNATALGEQEPPASATDVNLDEEAYALAQEFIGLSAAEMQAAIGEPTSVQYAASCLEEGAEDGMLFYPGFYVWTVRNGADETVHDVYLNN